MTWCSNRRRAFARASLIGAACLVAVAVLAVLPTAARAFGAIPLSPESFIKGEYPAWTTSAQVFARTIYMYLLVFEFIALGITALLFRENVGEFFSSIGLKIVVGGFFFWFIANGPHLASTVIGWFINVGQGYGGLDPTILISGCFAAAYALFGAADTAHDMQQLDLATLSIFPSCWWFTDAFASASYCPVGPIAAVSGEHPIFVILAQGLALMILMATAGIVLQFSIVTIESYLVMSVGILYIGFAGSRFTMPFSQGYFSYMINVGTKLMVTYIMLGVATKELLPILLGAGIAAIAASLAPLGITDAVGLAGVAIAAVYTVLTMGLLWTIPAFTAALLSGQSQSSGFAILQQAVGSFAGATQMMSQFGAAKHQADTAKQDRAEMAEINRAHAAGAGGASSASGYTSQPMAPGAQVDPFGHGGVGGNVGGASGIGGAVGGIGVHAGSGSGSGQHVNHVMVGGAPSQQALPSASPYGGSGSGPINPSNGASYNPGGASGSSSGETLYGKSAAEIAAMHDGEFSSALQNTDYSLLEKDRKAEVAAHHSEAASKVLADKAAQADESGDLSRAYGLGGLAQVAQREIGQPSAVQVRISNPDKL